MQDATVADHRPPFRSLRTAGLLVVAGCLLAAPSVGQQPDDEPAFLGVQLREATERPGGGARVTYVVEDAPAAEAGLRVGDIVIGFEDDVIRGPVALTQRIHERSPGDTVVLTLIRNGAQQRVQIELGRRTGSRARIYRVPPPVAVVPDEIRVAPEPLFLDPDEDLEELEELEELQVDPEALLERFGMPEGTGLETFRLPLAWQQRPRLGVQLVETTPELRRHLGGSDEAGVLVSKILSGLPAEKAGLQVGDLIVAVDGEPVASSSELIRELRDKLGRTFPIEIVRDHRTRTIEVTIPEPEADRPTGPRA